MERAPLVSFPAGASAEGKGIHGAEREVDPLPSLCSPGMTAERVFGPAPHRIGMAGTRPAMTTGVHSRRSARPVLHQRLLSTFFGKSPLALTSLQGDAGGGSARRLEMIQPNSRAAPQRG